MRVKVIDSHIHFDWYEEEVRQDILAELDTYQVEALITVSENLISARKNLEFSRKYPSIHAAFGYHPEQQVPTDSEMNEIIDFIWKYGAEMIAIGEVGLPYYLCKQDPSIKIEPYKQLLELFIEQAKLLEKPIVLHAVYEDAETTCDLLEKHSIEKAHFHWFKGSNQVINRMKHNGYYISITPDVLYEEEIRMLVRNYPLSLMMVETDGPWPFLGPFKNKVTQPKMLHHIVKEIATIKDYDLRDTYDVLLKNTKEFYNI